MPKRRWWRRGRDYYEDDFDEESIWIDPRGPGPHDEPFDQTEDDDAGEPEEAPAAEIVEAEEEPAPEPVAEDAPAEDEEEEPEAEQRADEAPPEQAESPDEAEPEADYAEQEERDEQPRLAAPVRDVIRPGPASERLGPRRAALHEKRRRRRRRAIGTLAALLTAGVIAGGIVLLDVFAGNDGSAGDGPVAAPGPQEDDGTTLLLFGTKESSSRPNAIWLSLLFLDEEDRRGAVVYVPAHTAVEVPGRGLQALGDSLSSGGTPLLLLSAETLLGVPIDNYVELSNTDARLLFNATGPLSVEVPDQVRVSAGPNKAKLIFDEGLQRLPSSFLAQLLYTVGLEADDVDLGARHSAFWLALFTQFEDDPEELAAALETAGGALGESDADPDEVAALLEKLARLRGPDRALASLPVTPVSVGGSELFEADTDEIETFMRDTLGIEPSTTQLARVQILNGNGEPGIGREAAERLVGHGFRVVLTGNAPRLDYKKSLVVTYDTTPEGTALAERARELLGVGKVQVSAQAQGIVDLTIVVGKDFLRTR